MRPGPTHVLTRLFAWSYLWLAVLYVLMTLVSMFVFRYPTLVFDQWHFYSDYFELPVHEALWKSQNGHRLVFSGLLLLADIHLFRASNVFLLVCIGVTYAFAALLLQAPRPVPPAWRGLILQTQVFPFLLLFWLGMRSCITRGLAVHYSLLVLAVVAACTLLAGSQPSAPDARSRRTLWRFAAAVLLGVVATFTFGNGYAIWPSLVAIAHWRRLSRWALIALVVAGLGFTGLYVVGANPHQIDPLANVLTRPLEVAGFAVQMLGAPAGQLVGLFRGLDSGAARLAAGLLGWLGVCVFGVGAVRATVARGPTPPVAAARLGVMLFCLSTSLVIAVMRLDRSSALEPRYLVWPLLFWAAVVAHLPWWLAGLRAPFRKPAGVAAGIVLLLAALALWPIHLQQSLAQARHSLSVSRGALAVALGVRDDETVAGLFFHPPVVYATARHLEERRLSVFAQGLDQTLGRPLEATFGPPAADRCAGGLVGSQPLPASAAGAWRVSGWAWDEKRNRAPALVVAADGDGAIRGLGLFVRAPPPGRARALDAQAPRLRRTRRISAFLPAALGWDGGWYGYVRDVPELGEVSFYAVLERPAGVCRIESAALD